MTPEEHNRLARVLVDPQSTVGERNEAAHKLRPLVAKLARSVVRKRSLNRHDDLIDDLTQTLFLKLAQPPAYRGQPFAPWCLTVLNNLLNEFHRRNRRLRLHTDQGESPPEPGAIEPRFRILDDRMERLPQDDLERIETWECSNRDRVIALAVFLIDRYVPDDIWSGWIGSIGLSRPFPPEDFAELNLTDRYRILAAIFGTTVVNLRQIASRMIPRIIGLRFIREYTGVDRAEGDRR